MKNTALQNLDLIAQALFDKKGFNILVLDAQGVSTMADYYVIAEGSVDRHVKALGLTVLQAMEEAGEKPLHTEGGQQGDWMVIDFGNIVIHLFIPELREKYALENLWDKAKIVDVKIVSERPQSNPKDNTVGDL